MKYNPILFKLVNLVFFVCLFFLTIIYEAPSNGNYFSHWLKLRMSQLKEKRFVPTETKSAVSSFGGHVMPEVQ